MQIAVASGKGGTGKTTFATSLALALVGEYEVRYIDCDVEAPDGHLFLNPLLFEKTEAMIPVPEIRDGTCNACGRCVEICRFHALARLGGNILIFPQLCHGCGSCAVNCPEKAMVENPKPIGLIEKGLTREGVQFLQGSLTISEPMPTPIIRQLKKLVRRSRGIIDIFDAPPGASCSVVETVRGVDFVFLVTEPTPFGLHDLRQMLGVLREMRIPAGVVINRDGIGDGAVEAFCRAENLPIVLRIPFDRGIARGIAEGRTLLDIAPHYSLVFRQLVSRIQKEY